MYASGLNICSKWHVILYTSLTLMFIYYKTNRSFQYIEVEVTYSLYLVKYLS